MVSCCRGYRFYDAVGAGPADLLWGGDGSSPSYPAGETVPDGDEPSDEPSPPLFHGDWLFVFTSMSVSDLSPMKATTLLALFPCLALGAQAQSILFDFDSAPAHTPFPIS